MEELDQSAMNPTDALRSSESEIELSDISEEFSSHSSDLEYSDFSSDEETGLNDRNRTQEHRRKSNSPQNVNTSQNVAAYNGYEDLVSPWVDPGIRKPSNKTRRRKTREENCCQKFHKCHSWFTLPLLRTFLVVCLCIVSGICGTALVRLVVYLSTGTPSYNIGKMKATGNPPDFVDLLLVGILSILIFIIYAIFKKLFKSWIETVVERILVASGNQII